MKALLAAALLLGGSASAADLTVLSTTGLTTTLEALTSTFETKSGEHPIVTFATTVQLKKKIDEGAAFDLCILTAPVVDEMIKSGKTVEPRTELVGPLPPDLQSITTFSAGISAKTANSDGARKLVEFLTSPDAIATIRLKGMDPG